MQFLATGNFVSETESNFLKSCVFVSLMWGFFWLLHQVVSDCSPITGANRQWNQESVELLHQEEAEAERNWPKHSQTTFRNWKWRESIRNQKKQWRQSLWRIQWFDNPRKREFRQGNLDSLPTTTTTNSWILPRQICFLPWKPHHKLLFPTAELQ